MDTTTLELRRGTPSWGFPVIVGQWRRDGDDKIIATYDAEELAYALACVGKTRAAMCALVDLKRERRLRSEARRLRGL